MTAFSKNGGPAFGAHAYTRAGEWTREGAERVIGAAARRGRWPRRPRSRRAHLPAREGKGARRTPMKY